MKRMFMFLLIMMPLSVVQNAFAYHLEYTLQDANAVAAVGNFYSDGKLNFYAAAYPDNDYATDLNAGSASIYFRIVPDLADNSPVHFIDGSLSVEIICGATVNKDTQSAIAYFTFDASNFGVIASGEDTNCYDNGNVVNYDYTKTLTTLMTNTWYYVSLEYYTEINYGTTFDDDSSYLIENQPHAGVTMSFSLDYTRYETIQPPATPVPGTVLLLGSGLIGLAGMSRKKDRGIPGT